MTGSNRRPPACKAGALPAELIPQSYTDKLSMRTAYPGIIGQHTRQDFGGSGWIRTIDPRLIKTVL